MNKVTFIYSSIYLLKKYILTKSLKNYEEKKFNLKAFTFSYLTKFRKVLLFNELYKNFSFQYRKIFLIQKNFKWNNLINSTILNKFKIKLYLLFYYNFLVYINIPTYKNYISIKKCNKFNLKKKNFETQNIVNFFSYLQQSFFVNNFYIIIKKNIYSLHILEYFKKTKFNYFLLTKKIFLKCKKNIILELIHFINEYKFLKNIHVNFLFFYLDKNSYIHYTYLSSKNSLSISNTDIFIVHSNKSKYEAFFFQKGNLYSRIFYYLKNLKQHTENKINLMMYLTSNNFFESNYYADIHKNHISTNFNIYTIVEKKSNVIFNGIISIQKMLNNIFTVMNCKGIIFGKNSSINFKPELDIKSPEVQCIHKVTILNLNNKNNFFYLQTRGLDFTIIKKFFKKCFFYTLINLITNKMIQIYIKQHFKNK